VKNAAIGAAAAMTFAPLPAMAALETPEAPLKRLIGLKTVNDAVQKYLRDLPADEINKRLDGVYARVFTYSQLDRMTDYDGEIGLGYAITRKTIRENLVEKELPGSVNGLIGSFREFREVRAAGLFNNPYTAEEGHPALLSLDKGNAFEIPRELNGKSFKLAIERVEKGMGAKPRALLVPSALADAANKATNTLPILVWPHLTNKQAWFVLTDASGLTWGERDPYEMDSWVDNITDNILVKAYERSGFTITNSNSVFGSAPAARYCEALSRGKAACGYKLEGEPSQIIGLRQLLMNGGA